MLRRCVRNERAFLARRCAPALLLLSGFVVLAPQAPAQTALPAVTIGGGLRTSFVNTEPTGADSTNQFLVNDARLYVNGSVTDKIKFMFNTDYNSATNAINVLDAVAEIALAPSFNIWAGRFLEPSDRANLYGPFYAHNWNVYTDGVQNGQPSVFQGRDNGVAYWGDFGKKVKMKISAGAFDGRSATGDPDVLGAARVQFDFWDAESGYYLNGTYYGDKNLLAIGGSTQFQSGKTANTFDFLLEKKLGNGGAISIESEYADYNGLGGYVPKSAKSQGAYVLGAYIFPKAVGIGKFEILGKFAKAESFGQKLSVAQKTTEVNLNYLIKQFNARIMTFYDDTRFNKASQVPNFWQIGIGLQVQI
jgi:Phosphate-selective porin O and P